MVFKSSVIWQYKMTYTYMYHVNPVTTVIIQRLLPLAIDFRHNLCNSY